MLCLALAVHLPQASSPPVAADTIRIVDDLGRTLTFPVPATRIVSLIPAATEILFELGAGDQVVGRTQYGTHPPEAIDVPDVGEGIRPSAEVVLARSPDAVVLFAGPDNEASVAEFERLGIPTLALYHNSFRDLERNIERLGALSGHSIEAAEAVTRIRAQLAEVAALTREVTPVSVYYDLWANPPITIGAGSYLDSLVRVAGGSNVFGDLPEPSPQVSLEAIVVRDPTLVIVPVESGTIRDTPADRQGWAVVPAIRENRVRNVEADLLHRLGPRIGDAAVALALAIHPELSARLAPLRSAADSATEPRMNR